MSESPTSLVEHHKEPCSWPDPELQRPSGDVTRISPGATSGEEVQGTPCLGTVAGYGAKDKDLCDTIYTFLGKLFAYVTV